jgi:purine-binding chemotaxis protein CheW
MSGTRRLARMDWQGIQQRLETASRNLRTVLDDAPELAFAAMEERTRRLAQPSEHADASAGGDARLEVLRFRMEGETYALETRFVREVARPGAITRLPGGAAKLAGLVSRRGALIPVFELAAAPAESGSPRWLLLLGRETIEAALLVDAIDEVAIVDPKDLQPPPPARPGNALTLQGIVADMAMLLDGTELLQGDTLRNRPRTAG